jgi:hypothetical protein
LKTDGFIHAREGYLSDTIGLSLAKWYLSGLK